MSRMSTARVRYMFFPPPSKGAPRRLMKRRLVGWSQKLVEIRKALGLTPDGDEEPAIVPNHGFAECYTHVGDEKYRKAPVSLRRAEYRFCSFVSAKSDEGTSIVDELLARTGGQGGAVGLDANDTS